MSINNNKQLTKEQLETKLRELAEENLQLKKEIEDLKETNRRISQEHQKDKKLKSFYYKQIKKAAYSLNKSLGTEPLSLSQIEQNKIAVQELKRGVKETQILVDYITKFTKEINSTIDDHQRLDLDISLTFTDMILTEASLQEEEVHEDNDQELTVNLSGIEESRFKIECVSNLREDGIIGGNWTHIALKNSKSFMIGTKNKGIKLFENNSLIYSGKLHLEHAYFGEIIYIESLNCYILNLDLKLYRKYVDDEPPYLYMNFTCGNREGAAFRHSKINQRLITIKDYNKIAAINLQRKDIEIVLKNTDQNRIVDFRLFGKKEDKVICLDQDGGLMLLSLDYSWKDGSVLANQKIELWEDRNELPRSLCVCDRNLYVFVEVGQISIPWLSSRMLILKVSRNGERLIKKAMIDHFGKRIP